MRGSGGGGWVKAVLFVQGESRAPGGAAGPGVGPGT